MPLHLQKNDGREAKEINIINCAQMHDLIGTCAYLKYACIQVSHYPLVASGVLDNTVEAIGQLSNA